MVRKNARLTVKGCEEMDVEATPFVLLLGPGRLAVIVVMAVRDTPKWPTNLERKRLLSRFELL